MKSNTIQNADVILIDGQGIALKHGDVISNYTHEQINNLVIDEIVNEIRQVANPDHLPYNRTEGF